MNNFTIPIDFSFPSIYLFELAKAYIWEEKKSYQVFLMSILIGVALVVSFANVKTIFKKNYGGIKKQIKSTKYKEIPYWPCVNIPGIWIPGFVQGILIILQGKKHGIKVFERIILENPNQDIVRMSAITKEVHVVLSPTLMQALLSSNDKAILGKPAFFYDFVIPDVLTEGLIGINVNAWQIHRKILNKCFTISCFPAYLRTMNKHAKALISQFLHQYQDKNRVVSGSGLHDQVSSFTIRVITEILLGEQPSTEEEYASFVSSFDKILKLIMYRFFNPHNLLPFIWRLNPKKKLYDALWHEEKEYVKTAIYRFKESVGLLEGSNVKANSSPTAERYAPPKSIVEEMLRHNASDEEIFSEVSTFVGAGHETTSKTLQFFLQNVAENPETQVLCQQEIDSMFDSKSSLLTGKQKDYENPNLQLTLADFGHLKYFDRCISETLRLISPVFIILRQLSQPMEVESYYFKKDTIFLFPLAAIQRDPNNFSDPEKFDPDRFLPENVEKRSPGSYSPFSTGPRNCIGYRVALLEIKVVLAWILRHFDVSTEDRIQDVKLIFEVTTQLERDFKLTLTPRKKIPQ